MGFLISKVFTIVKFFKGQHKDSYLFRLKIPLPLGVIFGTGADFDHEFETGIVPNVPLESSMAPLCIVKPYGSSVMNRKRKWPQLV